MFFFTIYTVVPGVAGDKRKKINKYQSIYNDYYELLSNLPSFYPSSFHSLLLQHLLSTNSYPLLKNVGPTQAPWQ